MIDQSTTSTPRRGFLGRLAAVAAAAGVSAVPRAMFAEPSVGAPVADEWLEKLKGKHRQFFDFPAHGAGGPLVHMLNYYNTLNTAYNVKDSDINTVGTFYGLPDATTLFAFNDAMWAKYNMGAAGQIQRSQDRSAGDSQRVAHRPADHGTDGGAAGEHRGAAEAWRRVPALQQCASISGRACSRRRTRWKRLPSSPT